LISEYVMNSHNTSLICQNFKIVFDCALRYSKQYLMLKNFINIILLVLKYTYIYIIMLVFLSTYLFWGTISTNKVHNHGPF